MPGNALKIVLVAVATAAIGGCGLGDDGTIPQDNADDLLSRLEAVETNVNSGACDLAREQAGEFSELVASLPAEVDGEVKAGLRQAADRLVELTADDSECVDTGATGEAGTVPPTEEVETAPEEETTTTETTTDEETAPEEAPPEEDEEAPPEEDEAPPAEEDEEEPPDPPNGGDGEGGGIGPTGGVGGGGGE